jgi:maltose O-acetyltransferase
MVEIGRGVEFNVPVRGGGRGTIRLGERCKFGYPLAHRLGTGQIMLQARTVDAVIALGCDNYINNNSVLCAMESIRIGSKCMIGDLVAIYDCDFHEINPAGRFHGMGVARPVIIGNNVWIGSRAMILKGVTIGDNSVIGAMSLVTKEIPANCIAAGVPAKVIRAIP